jgi:Raf kinase inhibitor-like YbhB/YbcL family protein
MEASEASGTNRLAGWHGANRDETTTMNIRYGVTLSWIRPASIFLVLGLSSGCGDRGATLPAVNPAAQTIRLTSPAFTEGGRIPREFTCDGADRSPPLEWSGVPQTARSLVLICDDPDALGGTWSHWVLFDMAPSVTSLDAGVAAEHVVTLEPKTANQQPKPTFSQGKNDFGKIGYGGPCPPRGVGVHRYVFHLYALDQRTELPPGATRATVFRAIEGHIVAEGRLLGKYAR